ncbi:MAG: hypothetical protein IPN94_10760 [Sphingobacteriales bacterium]|nr:hypothetical protein [Sphingobacteriales bacterium]
MASLVKTYSSGEAIIRQIYTPTLLSVKILDQVGYLGEQLLGKTILDPVCGDGRFADSQAHFGNIRQQKPLAQNLEKYMADVDEERQLSNVLAT